MFDVIGKSMFEHFNDKTIKTIDIDRWWLEQIIGHGANFFRYRCKLNHGIYTILKCEDASIIVKITKETQFKASPNLAAYEFERVNL